MGLVDWKLFQSAAQIDCIFSVSITHKSLLALFAYGKRRSGNAFNLAQGACADLEDLAREMEQTVAEDRKQTRRVCVCVCKYSFNCNQKHELDCKLTGNGRQHLWHSASIY